MSEYEDEGVAVMQPLRGRKEKLIPEAGIFFVNPAEATYAMASMVSEGGKKRFLFNSMLCVNGDSTFFAAGPAVGAPMAVICMEKLIALGAKRIILVGWCGALQQGLEAGSVLLPAQAMCGEGTSRYYSSDPGPKPSVPLVAWLRDTLAQKGVAWQEGRVWSTDAPFRETSDLLARLRQEHDIVAIDMEYSALCTVAIFRGIEFASLMLVSDELWQKEWKSGFSTPGFRQRSQEMSRVLTGAMQSMPRLSNGV
ncbi:MAG: nucleoside phosphorylase [Pseudomonadota bacterium]